jgi:Histidine phosphatase superfamily (branch 1)
MKLTHLLPAAVCALLLLGQLPAKAQQAQTREVAAAESSAPDPTRALSGRALADALRKGGYVVYFRHTATDFSKNDAGMKSYTDCANQRLLSPQGRADARALGERIRALKLPVGEVLASPYCRTMDTATLAMNRATPANEIRESEGGSYPGLKRLLASPVAAGTNRWVFGHGIPFRAVAGAPHLAEGEAAVIQPGGDRWTVVARLTLADWRTLAR